MLKTKMLKQNNRKAACYLPMQDRYLINGTNKSGERFRKRSNLLPSVPEGDLDEELLEDELEDLERELELDESLPRRRTFFESLGD